MRISSFFGLAGLVVIGWIVADLMTHPTASKNAYDAANTAISTSGNLVAGNFPSAG